MLFIRTLCAWTPIPTWVKKKPLSTAALKNFILNAAIAQNHAKPKY